MAYVRVIPRDLFNEASLLKCLGQLVLQLERVEHKAYLQEPVSAAPFEIDQDPSSGSISVVNLPFSINGKPYRLTRPLNSRYPWPLYCEDDDDTVAVFSDANDGELSDDFERLIGSIDGDGFHQPKERDA